MNTKTENIMGGDKGRNLITKRELACRLKRTVRTIMNWQRRGLIPYIKWRHAVYFDWDAVQARLETKGGEGGPGAQGCQIAPGASPQTAESDFPVLKGLARLPVYHMRPEPKRNRNCRRARSAPRSSPQPGTPPRPDNSHQL